MSKRNDLLLEKRICYVCLQEIPISRALFSPWLSIMVHLDKKCHHDLNSRWRIYDRSKRGRLQSKRELLAQLRELRRERQKET